MDKESIIKKRVAPLAPTYNLTIADCQQIVFPAMDEFAKQEAIGFAEWAYRNFHMTLNDVGNWHPRHMELSSKNDFTTEELYSLYKSQVK